MSRPDPGAITRLLHAHRGGDRGAFDELFALLQGELRKMARQQLRRSAPGHTLETVALVHEAYLRLLGEGRVDWQDRAHFFAVTARAMRFVLVDHARRAAAGKRGGDLVGVALDSGIAGATTPAEEEMAEALGVSLRTVQRDWMRARAWLQRALAAPPT
jgi:RNA polymerase sigma factor (TIGR02999 family)